MRNYLFGIIISACVIISCLELIRTGYVLDSNPEISESIAASVIGWSALILSVIGAAVVAASIMKSGVISRTAAVTVVIAAFAVILNSFYYYNEYRTYGISDEDYIESEWIKGNTLKITESILAEAEDSLVYIGRDDCKDCAAFEEKLIPILKKEEVQISAYYTNLDREKPDNREYENFLKKYEINSVPCVFWVKEKKIYQRWDDPITHLDEIKSAMR